MTSPHRHPGDVAAPGPAPEPRTPFVLRVGLTGGIATGKSTVARIFENLGGIILDADEVAHRLIEKAARAYAPVLDAFGPSILRQDGSIDRGRLGGIVFADPERRAVLESILHPMIRDMEMERVTQVAASGQGRIVVSNAALLIETGFYRDYHRVIVVHCDESEQIARIFKRDGMSESEARQRIAAQMDTREKLKVAHYAIDTTPGFTATEVRTRTVFRHLQLDLQALSEAS